MDPELGRISFPPNQLPTRGVWVSYYYGFPADIGGGSYERGQSPEQLFLSPAEVAEPHMKLVYDLIVRQHPAFTEFRVENANWGWARKAPGEPRTYKVQNTTSLSAIALGQAVKVRNRLLARRRG